MMPCLLAVPLLVVSQVRAQVGRGMGFGAGYYDGPSNMVIHGVVETVEDNAYNCRWGATELTLKADRVTYVVQLGPTRFLSHNNFSIAKGDELSVTGFNFTCQGTAFLVAREMTKGGKTLTLRNALGVPAWAGRGMGWSSTGGWRGGGGGLCCGCRCRCWWRG
jgi:hypothetical protein